MKEPMIMKAVMWVSVSVAVCLSVYITRSPNALWTFLLPALVSVANNNGRDKK